MSRRAKRFFIVFNLLLLNYWSKLNDILAIKKNTGVLPFKNPLYDIMLFWTTLSINILLKYTHIYIIDLRSNEVPDLIDIWMHDAPLQVPIFYIAKIFVAYFPICHCVYNHKSLGARKERHVSHHHNRKLLIFME